jgi:hypothetical protein
MTISAPVISRLGGLALFVAPLDSFDAAFAIISFAIFRSIRSKPLSAMKKGPRKPLFAHRHNHENLGFRGGTPSYEDDDQSNNIAHVISL